VLDYAFTQLHMDALIFVLLLLSYRAEAKRLPGPRHHGMAPETN